MMARFTVKPMNTSNTTATVPSTLDLGVGGMTCASCVSRVERALKKVPGVQDATVNLATESARITYAASAQAEALLRRAVRDAGYEPRSAEAAMEEDLSPWAGFLPVAIGLVLSAPLVLPMLGDLFGQHWMLPAWAQFALATPVASTRSAMAWLTASPRPASASVERAATKRAHTSRSGTDSAMRTRLALPSLKSSSRSDMSNA